MDHSSSPPDEEDLPSSHPARRREFGGKNEKKRGWGEAMELAHQTESGLRNNRNGDNYNDNDNDRDSGQVVAVDLNQFRNTEVGVGYQAKHVVRQKTATVAKTKTRTINSNSNVGVGRENSGVEDQTKPIETEELLRNAGLRAFRTEIENILSSS